MTSEINNILISPEWLAEQIPESGADGAATSAAAPTTTGGFTVVDTRGPNEYKAGHIPGAVNLPSGSLYDPQTPSSDLLPPELVEQRVAEAGIDADSHLIFYDDSGLVPSARVFWALENYGRDNMSLLDGGFLGWMTRKLPVERANDGNGNEDGADGTAPSTRAAGKPFRASREGHAYATRDDVLAAIEDPDTVIIDTRTEEEYRGRTATHQRNGHIPGAKNVDWQNHIVDLFDPTLKSPDELRKLYREIGLDESKRAIVYCRTGSRSSHTYFVLRYLGFTNVRNYKRSWMEWNVDESVPVES
jgi:thiosulfate/3-mercaptopyruvate sulfurtransferase